MRQEVCDGSTPEDAASKKDFTYSRLSRYGKFQWLSFFKFQCRERTPCFWPS